MDIKRAIWKNLPTISAGQSGVLKSYNTAVVSLKQTMNKKVSVYSCQILVENKLYSIQIWTKYKAFRQSLHSISSPTKLKFFANNLCQTIFRLYNSLYELICFMFIKTIHKSINHTLKSQTQNNSLLIETNSISFWFYAFYMKMQKAFPLTLYSFIVV